MAILFISMFALDSFAPGLPLWEQIRDFLIHLAPSYALVLILWLAWVREKWGGWLFIVLGAATAVPVFMLNYQRSGSAWMALGIVFLINLPVIMVGAMFLVSHYLKNK